MGRKIKSLIITGGLSLATIATFTGCAKGDRSSGQYIDDRMTARKVKSDLKHNPIYKFEEVSVNAYRGVVQLSGWVTKPEQKQLAERIARNTPGVVDVVNNVTFKPQFQLVQPAGQTYTGGTSSGTTQQQGSQTSQDNQRQQQEQRTQDQINRQQDTNQP